MPKLSAGLLIYRHKQNILQVLLVHPGGPFFKKDIGEWSIPKGEYSEGEDPLSVAQREFTEETGNSISPAVFKELKPVKIKSGKIISAWIVEEDFAEPYKSSNTFKIEWPPRSGKMSTFPEIDKAGWFTIDEARIKITAGQLPLLDQLEDILSKG